MSIESYRAEEASQQHLPSSRPKKVSPRQAPCAEAMASPRSCDAASVVTSQSASQTTSASGLVAEDASEDPVSLAITSASVIATDSTV
jgi:hypothetical protein